MMMHYGVRIVVVAAASAVQQHTMNISYLLVWVHVGGLLYVVAASVCVCTVCVGGEGGGVINTILTN